MVGEASDGAEAIKAAKELTPDVVLMDLKMPGTDGVAATLEIKRVLSDTSVLVLTSFLEDETVRSVLRAGATGYLMKDAAPSAVAEAVRTVHRGQPMLHPDVLRRVMSDFAGEEPTRVSNGPTGTLTIAFTDIENSSELIRELGDEAARPLFREHDEVVRSTLRPHGAREVQHLGDGFMLAFSSARSAISCAIEIQRAMKAFDTDRPEVPLRVRIGVHTGEVIAEDHGYFGEAVWRAARIVSKAEGGQILVSELTRQLVGTACACADKGEFALKGLPGLHRLYEVSWVQ